MLSGTSTRSGRSASSSGCRSARRGPAARSRRVRHEGRHRCRAARDPGAARARLSPPSPRSSMLWTTDEEVGSGNVARADRDEARECRAVLVLEPSLPGGAAKTSRKGVRRVRADRARRRRARGYRSRQGRERDPRAGAADPRHRGAARTSSAASPSTWEPSSGGTRTNVVADARAAGVDVRVRRSRPRRCSRRGWPRCSRARRAPGSKLTGGVSSAAARADGGGRASCMASARTVAAELGSELAEGAAGRRVGREFHGRGRGSNTRRTRSARRWRARASTSTSSSTICRGGRRSWPRF